VIFNVFDDDWLQGTPRQGYVSGVRPLGSPLRAEKLGATVYAMEAGERLSPYHFHFAEEEWLLVLDGEPTLRTPDGVAKLRTGDIVAFERGPGGAHEVRNDTASTVRVLMISTKEDVDVGGFPDSGKMFASANRLGPGERVRLLNRPEANLDYAEE
jgi:uncharacterized cupin superfamily protein